MSEAKLQAYYRYAKEDLFPKMKSSSISITIAGEPDPKLCLELGAMILFDKPIIVLVPEGHTLPANLKRVAAAIVYGNPQNPHTMKELQNAITSVSGNDQRAKS